MELLTAQLTRSIEGLYEAFADQPTPSVIDGCYHCFEEGELDRLVTSPLRELTADDLTSYASSAFLTAGDVPDYLYLLPRIIQVSIADRGFWPALEITGRAIHDSGFSSWPERRKVALLEVLEGYLEQVVNASDGSEIDSVVCMLGKIDVPLEPYLAKIGDNPSAIAAYRDVNAKGLTTGKLTNSFWEPSDTRQHEVVEWFKSRSGS